MDIWTVVRFIHLLSVAGWLGGMLFLGLVVVPVVRASGGIEKSRALVTAVGRRFGWLGGIAWVGLLVTGMLLLHHRNVMFSDLPDTEYGKKVLTKFILLMLIGVAVVFHGVVQGPRVRRAEAAGDAATRRTWQIVGGLIDAFLLLATLVALFLAASLVS